MLTNGGASSDVTLTDTHNTRGWWKHNTVLTHSTHRTSGRVANDSVRNGKPRCTPMQPAQADRKSIAATTIGRLRLSVRTPAAVTTTLYHCCCCSTGSVTFNPQLLLLVPRGITVSLLLFEAARCLSFGCFGFFAFFFLRPRAGRFHFLTTGGERYGQRRLGVSVEPVRARTHHFLFHFRQKRGNSTPAPLRTGKKRTFTVCCVLCSYHTLLSRVCHLVLGVFLFVLFFVV